MTILMNALYIEAKNKTHKKGNLILSAISVKKSRPVGSQKWEENG